MNHQIDKYFHRLIERGGSDLHLSEGQPPKIRVHGEIVTLEGESVLTKDVLEGMMKEIARDEGWERYVSSGDLDFAYEMDEESRFRCNYLKQSNGYACVFRLIPTKISSLEQLGIPDVVREFGHIRSGLVLVTGPTGSGKSTTLAALMDYININFSRHIITVEEPIEFVHNNKMSIITQREVPIQTPSFADGLRAALREDADIVLVGEMRDLETISLALTAAETGLLVFGTLHTNNARKTVDRLIDVFPADKQSQIRTMLAASLKGVVAQLLCKCDDTQVNQDTGSPLFTGRVAVNEIMVSNSAVAAIIREGATQKLYDVIIGGKSEGMQFMDESIWEKLKSGMISPFEAYMKSIDKKRFKEYLPENLQELAHSGGGEIEGAAASD